jgi:hypoxanthine-DNA glycosylase
MIKQGLKPIIDETTKILILGSLPGDESIEKQEYYAKKTNDFWKLLGEVLNEDFNTDYKTKLQLLNKHHIGLWDVFHQSYREGSLDNNIKDEMLNDFSKLKQQYPKIKLICLNGKKAGEHKKVFEELGYKTIVLPSSSGANRRVDRIPEWEIITK